MFCATSVNALNHGTEIYAPNPVRHRHDQCGLRLHVADKWLASGDHLRLGGVRAGYRLEDAGVAPLSTTFQMDSEFTGFGWLHLGVVFRC
jgi:hypothetical protein